MKKTISTIIAITALVGLAFMLNPANAAQEAKVDFDVCSEAKITKFDYPIMEKCKIAKDPCVTFVMTIKNVSDKPQRFMARIVMPDEGKGVGGFIPRKGKKDKATGKKMPPVVEPGESKTVKYPSLMFEMPKKIEVQVTVVE